MVLETKRLFLREIKSNDFIDLCKILQSDSILRAFTHIPTNQEVLDWLELQFKEYAENGIGFWAVISKESYEMIGYCGLHYVDLLGDKIIELGYFILQSEQNKGYASEVAKACKEYAFSALNAEEVYSIIREDNIPSQKVAQKNGMKIKVKGLNPFFGMDMPHIAFSTCRPT